MGQGSSSEYGSAATPEHLSKLLAQRLATKCFQPLELTHFKDNFVTLADETDGLKYWKEDTICRFLQIPDVLEANLVLGQMLGYLGAWPFGSLAPAILTREALCKIVVLLTNRYQKVLKGGRRDRVKVLFRSLAVLDRRLSQYEPAAPEIHDRAKESVRKDLSEAVDSHEGVHTHTPGFNVDQPGNDEEDEDDQDLVLDALDHLDSVEIYKPESQPETKASRLQIPLDNFRSLLLLLLAITPLQSEDPLASLATRCNETAVSRMKSTADSIVWGFAPEQHPGISYSRFISIVQQSLPFVFDGFDALFEHFLFSKNIDLNRRRSSSVAQKPLGPKPTEDTEHAAAPEPILSEEGKVLTPELLCQISFFIPNNTLFHRLRLLYSGTKDGFSMNSFEQKVLNWRAPTITLIRGARQDSVHDLFPAKRFKDGSSGNSKSQKLTFGSFLNTPWQTTPKSAMGDTESLLFQLEPVHEVWRASQLNKDYATLSKSGIAFGSPVPRSKPVSGLSSNLVLGPVSLTLDENLETGVFIHDSAGGGAYGTSKARKMDWEERFEIEELEVWGCGGDEVAKEQRERWQWEEREALARRGIRKSGDKDADYALLEMAGLVGGHGNSGGSMG